MAILSFILFIPGLHAQEIPVPPGYVINDTVYGDLTKDLDHELVVVYDTGQTTDLEGITRELIVYTRKQDTWVPLARSAQAVKGSLEGGCIGDPYTGIEVKAHTLYISHHGGCNNKWWQTDGYRFQDEELYWVHYQNLYGSPCDTWQEVIMELLTGKVTVKGEKENCDTETVHQSEQETFATDPIMIGIAHRQEHTIEVTSPEHKKEFIIVKSKDL